MKMFISSTVEDLKPEREKAIAIVDRRDQAVAMEKFFASNHRSKRVCLKWLQKCDALVLILGFKYGSIEKVEQISFTEMEYNAAKTLGLPIFAFLKLNRQRTWKSEETSEQRSKKLLAFKSRVDEEQYRARFTSPQGLQIEILGAIRQYEIEHGEIGVRVFAFSHYEDFFKPFTDKAKLFNHLYPLVGRKDYLRIMNAFVESEKKIALLYGRGGIGKSKILFEFSREFKTKHQRWKLRFLREGIPLSDDAIRQLPAQKCVIVVDDAHRREDLSTLLTVAQQYSGRLRIILSSRPQGLEYIRGTLTKTGFDPSEVDNVPEIRDLGISDLKELAKSVLGKSNQRFLELLIMVAKNSPLVLVIGGRLIAEKKIAPALLERHSDFHRAVFDRFQDVLMGEVSERLEAQMCRDVLWLISALSPIKPDVEIFQKKATEFLNIERVKLIDSIGILESLGVLVRRGYSLRITPDILSDHILHNACLTRQGDPTGYATKVFDTFGDDFSENVLFNLSELDWRIAREGKSINLLGEIWKIIGDQFTRASPFRQEQILNYLQRVAYFQPARILELVEYAIQNPSQTTEDEELWLPRGYTHKDVLHVLPPILRGIAFNLDYLPRCCDILWHLGRDDERLVNPYPDHAMRVLCELASYDIKKPLTVNFKVLDAVERWLKESDVHDHKHSVLDVLDPLLAKEGESQGSEGYALVLGSFPVDIEKTRPIHKKAIALLASCTRYRTTKVVLRALRSLMDFLNPPHALYGRTVSDGEVNRWLPEQMKVLEVIESVVMNTKDPIVHLKVASDLHWHTKRDNQADLAKKAKSIIGAIPNSFGLRIHRAIWNRYEWDRDDKDYSHYEERVREETKRTVNNFLARFKSGKNAFDFLNYILGRFKDCGIQPNPHYFLYLLGSAGRKVSIQICEQILSQPSSDISTHLSSLLSGLREKMLTKAVKLTAAAVRTGNTVLCSSIAHGYAWQGWTRAIKHDEIAIVKMLLRHPDKEVKGQSIRALRRFPTSYRNEALRLALTFDVDGDERLTEDLCEIFDSNPEYGIPPSELEKKDLTAILLKLIDVKKFTSGLYNIEQFLGYCSSLIPDAAVDFWLRRLDIAEKEARASTREYQPVPAVGFSRAFKGISSSRNWLDLLRKIRDRASRPTRTDRFYLPRLFAQVSSNFSLPSVEILDEWVESNDADKMKGVGLLIREVPREFVFSNVDFVSKLIEKSHIVSTDCYRVVQTGLFNSAAFGVKWGAPGQPMPADVRLRDQAKELSQRFQPGSPTQRFYLSLAKHAEREIRDDLARDEEFLDE